MAHMIGTGSCESCDATNATLFNHPLRTMAVCISCLPDEASLISSGNEGLCAVLFELAGGLSVIDEALAQQDVAGARASLKELSEHFRALIAKLAPKE